MGIHNVHNVPVRGPAYNNARDFSLVHASEDADAMVAFARSAELARKYHIDPDRIVAVGHSMGGYRAAWAAAHEPAVLGAVMIGAWDITEAVRGAAGSRDELMARAEKDDGTEPADFRCTDTVARTWRPRLWIIAMLWIWMIWRERVRRARCCC